MKPEAALGIQSRKRRLMYRIEITQVAALPIGSYFSAPFARVLSPINPNSTAFVAA